MSGRVERITEEVRKYDRRLYAYRNCEGKVLILRKGDRLEASDFNQCSPDLARLNPQLILALTDTWTAQGTPADWGIEPIMRRLLSMDAWRDPAAGDEMRKARERKDQDKERAKRNEIRARAADLRGEFAKATNDINTSILEKVDGRRRKDGSC